MTSLGKMELVALVVLFIQGVVAMSVRKCHEIYKCQYNEKTHADALSQGDMKILCPLMTLTVICKTVALNDCKKNPSYKESALRPIQQSLDRDNADRVSFCGAVPEIAECDDMPKCSQETQIVTAFINASMIEEACGLYQTHVRCVQSSYNNCKKRKIVQKSFNETYFEESKKFLDKNCAKMNHTKENDQKAARSLGVSSPINPGDVISISSVLLTLAVLESTLFHTLLLQMW